MASIRPSKSERRASANASAAKAGPGERRNERTISSSSSAYVDATAPQRIDPEKRQGAVGRELGEGVEPFDVRQLVDEHQPPTLGRPLVGFRRQEQRRMPYAPRHRHAEAIASQQANGATNAQRCREIAGEAVPRAVDHLRRATREAGHRGHPDHDAGQECDTADDPQ
jgi:hypothetical protein